MQYLIKKLNKYNGNICFAAVDAFANYCIYECDRNGYLYSAISSKVIKSICALDEKSWYVTFENSGWIGLFTKGTLTENFISTSFSEISQIELASGFFFIPEDSYNPAYKYISNYLIVLDRTNNTLTKFYLYNNDTQYSIYWTYTMPDPLYAESSYITVREDGYIIYTNNYNSYLISDTGNSATISQSLPISDGNSIFTAIIKNNETSYVRIRSVEGEELGGSSLSSSSTDSLSSKSSRSSQSSQSSSSSSQSGKIFYTISAGTPAPNPDPSGNYQAYGTCNSKTKYKKKGDGWYLIYASSNIWFISKSNASCSPITPYYRKIGSANPVGTYTNVGSSYTGSAIVGYVASSSSSSDSVSSSSSVILSRSSLSSESSSSESAQSASSKSLSSASSSSTSSSSSIIISRSSESSGSESSKSLSSYSSSSSIEIHSTSSVSWSYSSDSSSSLNGIWDWKLVGPQAFWMDIVSNSDGTKFAASEDSAGYIWTVEYSGDEWKWEPWISRVNAGQCAYPSGLVCSSDGNKLFDLQRSGCNVYSSIDSGISWSNAKVTGGLYDAGYAIACSSDGTKIVTSTGQGVTNYIYTSNNSGATWTRQIDKWLFAIASSSDGSKLAATGGYAEYIYTSNNSGVTWTQQIGSGISNWTDITSSADGSKLAACDGSYVYTSNNSGVTWTTRITPVAPRYISSSADGTVIAAGSSGSIIISTDSGSTWTSQPVLGNYNNIAVSANGNRIAAVSQNYYIYIGTRT